VVCADRDPISYLGLIQPVHPFLVDGEEPLKACNGVAYGACLDISQESYCAVTARSFNLALGSHEELSFYDQGTAKSSVGNCMDRGEQLI